MQAAVCRAFGEPLRQESVTLSPLNGDNSVIVRMAACAICHSDVTFADGGWGGDLPAIYGHEAAGIVEDAGSASGFAKGDRVIVTLVSHCGTCPCCRRGLEGVCETPPPREAVLHDADGQTMLQAMNTAAFADYVHVHASQLVRLDADLPADEASLIACGVITGWGAVSHATMPKQDDTIAVIGCGGVGLNAVQAAGHLTGAQVIALDISDDKLAMARTLGATGTINSMQEDATARLHQMTGGRGVDHVLVTVGAPGAMQSAVDLLAPGGQAVLVGLAHSGTMIHYDPVNLASYGQKIIGSKMGNAPINELIPELIQHRLSGELQLSPLITRRLPLSDINDAMDQMRRGEGLRSVIMFEGAGW